MQINVRTFKRIEKLMLENASRMAGVNANTTSPKLESIDSKIAFLFGYVRNANNPGAIQQWTKVRCKH